MHPQRVKAIASAKLKNDRGGFGDAGALVALRSVAGVVEGGPGDAGAATLVRQRTRLKHQVHAVLHQQGLRSPVTDVFAKRGAAVAGGSESAGAGAGVYEYMFTDDRSLRRGNSKTKPPTK